MSLTVASIDLHVHETELRMPFSFGNVTVTALPHAFLSLELRREDETEVGIAADGLSPLWFMKDTPFEQGLENTVAVIDAASRTARQLEPEQSVFDLWWRVYEEQERWASDKDYPPLLWGFGVSLVERAMIDAFCRLEGVTFPEAVQENHLGIEPGRIYDELEGTEPSDFLPESPRQDITVRHTVGLTDPLREDDRAEDSRVNDGLPETLDEYCREQGITHFKIKLSGDKDNDVSRLEEIQSVLDEFDSGDFRFTFDANEQYQTIADLRAFWKAVTSTEEVDALQENVLFIEQPLPRDNAFTERTSAELSDWTGRPPIIIDESDQRVRSLSKALDCGYDGTSHKNVKGVFKGIVNACLLRHRGDSDRPRILSGEDLSTIGPVSLLQDNTVMATLGIEHVERNGHHYFRGVDGFPTEIQERLTSRHSDLYSWHDDGFATVTITDGTMSTASCTESPFGYDIRIQPDRFTPIEEWEMATITD